MLVMILNELESFDVIVAEEHFVPNSIYRVGNLASRRFTFSEDLRKV